ncbi:hypothetical protein FEM48_Zijuj03G0017200 [Ziziphus jujuba var. spinosa]|uniref:AAA+ ATPase domain-containing protein n=1 Tax=Ziziphus jujuba var. spinosa TaxID=714518 RepID=A0A978VMF2_ZIZJJ|nr:hypothetical protein FEM48_Zijuj03G0017200 [Ziziphus jujuba var. spinosa]
MEVKQWKAEEVIGGNADALEALRELITFPYLFSGKAEKLGLRTSMVRAVVQECGVHLTEVDPGYVRSAHSGEQLLREAFSEASSHSISGGMPSRKLQQAVERPIKHSASCERLGIPTPRGILLHGPPGCSKTTLAKAAANAAQASFFFLDVGTFFLIFYLVNFSRQKHSCADIYSKYVGEGEALLRNIIRTARDVAPSIIFLDEVDNIAVKRGMSSNNDSTVQESLLITLLTEMDGLEVAKGILVLAATNRPKEIDAALMRCGRFDLMLYVPPPDLEARYEILHVHTHKMKISDDVDLLRIAEDTELFTGLTLKACGRHV